MRLLRLLVLVLVPCTGELAANFRKCRVVARSTAWRLVVRLGRRLDRIDDGGILDCDGLWESSKDKLCWELEKPAEASLVAIISCCGGSKDAALG